MSHVLGGIGRLDWAREGRDWPNRAASRFVEAAGLAWHVQVAGDGPALLALHGAAAASHSWGGLLPLLAARFTVIAPDLPGHGFSARAPGQALPLPEAARRVAGLAEALGLSPALAVGHSAGAAILARMALDGGIRPSGIVAVNGALVPFRGVPGLLLPAMARALNVNPLAPRLIATAAIDPNAVPQMLRGTGSRVPPAIEALYRRLFRAPSHVAGTLAMMADWDLAPLMADLPRLETPLRLLAGERDRAVPPRQAREIAALAPEAEIVPLPGLGHLAHEEDPGRVAAEIHAFADTLGL